MTPLNPGDRVILKWACPWYEHMLGEQFTVTSGIVCRMTRLGQVYGHRLRRDYDDASYFASPESLELVDDAASWERIWDHTGWDPRLNA